MTTGGANSDQGATLGLRIGGEQLGRIVPVVASSLMMMPELFAAEPGGFALRDAEATVTMRSGMLQEAATRLRVARLVPGWRDELCTLFDQAGSELAHFERGAFRTLGLQNRAVHVNGSRADGRLWIARRAAHKASSPNKLDNMAAGAITAGETPQTCALRELWEEAGVPRELAAGIAFTGQIIRSVRPLAHGLHDELIICADLELPDDFHPDCQDGEVAEFLCLTRDETHTALEAGQFSVEAGLVVENWLTRHP